MGCDPGESDEVSSELMSNVISWGEGESRGYMEVVKIMYQDPSISYPIKFSISIPIFHSSKKISRFTKCKL